MDLFWYLHHDSLPSREWVRKHLDDKIPEPTMVVVISGREFNLKGGIKKGTVKQLIKLQGGK